MPDLGGQSGRPGPVPKRLCETYLIFNAIGFKRAVLMWPAIRPGCAFVLAKGYNLAPPSSKPRFHLALSGLVWSVRFRWAKLHKTDGTGGVSASAPHKAATAGLKVMERNIAKIALFAAMIAAAGAGQRL